MFCWRVTWPYVFSGCLLACNLALCCWRVTWPYVFSGCLLVFAGVCWPYVLLACNLALNNELFACYILNFTSNSYIEYDMNCLYFALFVFVLVVVVLLITTILHLRKCDAVSGGHRSERNVRGPADSPPQSIRLKVLYESGETADSYLRLNCPGLTALSYDCT